MKLQRNCNRLATKSVFVVAKIRSLHPKELDDPSTAQRLLIWKISPEFLVSRKSGMNRFNVSANRNVKHCYSKATAVWVMSHSNHNSLPRISSAFGYSEVGHPVTLQSHPSHTPSHLRPTQSSDGGNRRTNDTTPKPYAPAMEMAQGCWGRFTSSKWTEIRIHSRENFKCLLITVFLKSE